MHFGYLLKAAFSQEDAIVFHSTVEPGFTEKIFPESLENGSCLGFAIEWSRLLLSRRFFLPTSLSRMQMLGSRTFDALVTQKRYSVVNDPEVYLAMQERNLDYFQYLTHSHDKTRYHRVRFDDFEYIGAYLWNATLIQNIENFFTQGADIAFISLKPERDGCGGHVIAFTKYKNRYIAFDPNYGEYHIPFNLLEHWLNMILVYSYQKYTRYKALGVIPKGKIKIEEEFYLIGYDNSSGSSDSDNDSDEEGYSGAGPIIIRHPCIFPGEAEFSDSDSEQEA